MKTQRENSANLLTKLRTTRHNLRAAMGYIDYRAPIATTAAAEPPNLKKEEPMWTLCSDSPTVMTSLRSRALDTGFFTFAFGCAPHALHNLCMDWMKADLVKKVVSAHLYIVKEIKKVHLLSAMFDKLCEREFHKKYSLILFTRTRWGTVLAMLERMLEVKKVLTGMRYAKKHEPAFREMPLSENLSILLDNDDMWLNTVRVVALLKPICAALTYLEGDQATFSSVWASFLYLAYQVFLLSENFESIMGVSKETLLKRVLFRMKSIYSPAHVLAFVTDPFYFGMRGRLQEECGIEFVELGLGDLVENCRTALTMIARGNADYAQLLMTQFSDFLSQRIKGSILMDNVAMAPDKAWANLSENKIFAALAKALIKIHRNPTGAVGGERNHKTNNRVRSNIRIRLKQSTCEKQVAVAYNAAVLGRKFEERARCEFAWILHKAGDYDDEAEDESGRVAEKGGYESESDGDEVVVVDRSDREDESEDEVDEDPPVSEDEFLIAADVYETMDQYLSDDSDFKSVVRVVHRRGSGENQQDSDDGGGKQPARPAMGDSGKASEDGGGKQPALQSVGESGKASDDGGGKQPARPAMGESGKASDDGGGKQPARPAMGESGKDSDDGGGKQPALQSVGESGKASDDGGGKQPALQMVDDLFDSESDDDSAMQPAAKAPKAAKAVTKRKAATKTAPKPTQRQRKPNRKYE
jgi:hypothetical protein